MRLDGASFGVEAEEEDAPEIGVTTVTGRGIVRESGEGVWRRGS